MTLPQTYPSTCKPNVYLSCGGDVSTSQRKDARVALARIVEEQEANLEILDLIINAFLDVLATFTSAPDLSASSSDVKRRSGTNRQTDPSSSNDQAQRIKHVVIWSHHLLATSKRRAIQSWSKDLRITGYARPGHPGAIFAEGEESEIDDFVRRLKALRWQALQVRAEDLVDERIMGETLGEGIVEVETLGEIAEGLKGRSAETSLLFLEGMKISGLGGH